MSKLKDWKLPPGVINLDMDPSSEFEDVPSLPMSLERQERIFASIRKAYKLKEQNEVVSKFEELYGYDPTIPMPEETQREVLDVLRDVYETDDLNILYEEFEKDYGYKPTI